MVLRLYNGMNLNNKENRLRNEPHTHSLWIIATQPDTATIIPLLFFLFSTINVLKSKFLERRAPKKMLGCYLNTSKAIVYYRELSIERSHFATNGTI